MEIENIQLAIESLYKAAYWIVPIIVALIVGELLIHSHRH